MVIVHLSGGFGNQLFSYAFGYAVARERKDTLAIDTAVQDAPWFFRNPDILQMNIAYDQRITYKVGSRLWERGPINALRFRMAIGLNTVEVKETQVDSCQVWSKAFRELICKENKIYVRGNWGSEKYFKPVAEEIKNQFSFRIPLSIPAQMIYDEIDETENSVGIHYRRGDYVKLGISPEPEYFVKSMKHIAERVKNPVFYCFSEDNKWVREQFKDLPYDIRYPKYKSENAGIEDFRLFGVAKHHIISNSSYSWWAAYLKEKEGIVVIPYNETWTVDFGPEGWVKLPFKQNGESIK